MGFKIVLVPGEAQFKEDYTVCSVMPLKAFFKVFGLSRISSWMHPFKFTYFCSTLDSVGVGVVLGIEFRTSCFQAGTHCSTELHPWSLDTYFLGTGD